MGNYLSIIDFFDLHRLDYHRFSGRKQSNEITQVAAGHDTMDGHLVFSYYHILNKF